MAADPAGNDRYETLALPEPVALGKPVRLHLMLKDSEVTVWRDGAFLGGSASA